MAGSKEALEQAREADLQTEIEALRAERDLFRTGMLAAERELSKAESRKHILAQVNQLLDDTLFRTTLARRVAGAAERHVDLSEICDACFALMRELVPLRGALVVVDVGERQALIAEESCPPAGREDAVAAWNVLWNGGLPQARGATTLPVFRGGTPVALLLAYPSKSTGFTERDAEILAIFAEHMRLPFERGA